MDSAVAVKAKCRARSLMYRALLVVVRLEGPAGGCQPPTAYDSLSLPSPAGLPGGWLEAGKLHIVKASWKRRFLGLHWSWFWIVYQSPIGKAASFTPLSFPPCFWMAVAGSWLLKELSSCWERTEGDSSRRGETWIHRPQHRAVERHRLCTQAHGLSHTSSSGFHQGSGLNFPSLCLLIHKPRRIRSILQDDQKD